MNAQERLSARQRSQPQRLVIPAPSTQLPSPTRSRQSQPSADWNGGPYLYQPDSLDDDKDQNGLALGSRDNDDGPSSASEFVKKLYRLLEENQHPNAVSWTASGDSFVVKDMNEFSKVVLPKTFKHGNFASFVRQLNKYDFHKVKGAEEPKNGEQTWTFRHPDFQANSKDALENIKRKVPAGRKQAAASQQRFPSSEQPSQQASAGDGTNTQNLQDQIDRLTLSQEAMRDLVSMLEGKYQNVLTELVTVQRTVVQQAELIQHLTQYQTVGQDSNGPRDTSQYGQIANSSQGQKLPSRQEFSGPSPDRVSTLASRSSQVNRVPSPPPAARLGSQSSSAEQQSVSSIADALGPFVSSLQRSAPLDVVPSNLSFLPENLLLPQNGGPTQFAGYPGLEVFTIGQLVERDANSADFQAQANNDAAGPWTGGSQQSRNFDSQFASTPSTSSSSDSDLSISRANSPRLRIRRGTYVPGWAVPPRVLLVDDDAVSRTLSSKLLQIAGCTFDVAVDGEVAVQRMNLEKYDLVLMDIVMPKLDGVSATSRIRQFDLSTPIISMTSNSTPSDLKRYFQHGMNDILSKPFNRDNLVNVLEKHLMHLKVIGHLNQVPRSLGIPPLNDTSFNQALTLPLISADDFEYRPNPLAGMGVSDQDYDMLVQGIVSNGLVQNKRFHEEDDSDSNDLKRARFEIVE